MSNYKDEQFYKTQETWKEEIKSHITQYKEQYHKTRIEFEYNKELWKRQRDKELKHIEEMKSHLDNKLKEVHNIIYSLKKEQQKRNKNYMREIPSKMRPFMKKWERRRGSHNSTTPTSPECSLTSPDSPQIVSTQMYS